MVFISDLHIPYEDKKAVELVVKFIEDFKPEILILGGDMLDFMGLSRFSKDPKRALTTQEDIDKVNKLLVRIRYILPNSEIVYLEGNHEFRMTNYKWTKCPELSYIKALTLPKLLNLGELGIQFIPYTKFYNYKKIYFVHGDVISKHSGQTAKQMLDKWGVNIICGHCFSEDTEILTRQGWSVYDKLYIGQEVLTYNLDNGNSEWNKINDIFVYDHYKELVSFKSHVTDLLVTPEHNIVYSPRYLKGKFRLSQAKNHINKRTDMPNGGNNTNPDYDIEDDLLRLCAWVITEGNYHAKCNHIRISQSEKEKVGIKHITDICDRVGQKYSAIKRYDKNTTVHGTHRNYDAYRINLNCSDITKKIIELFPEKQLNNLLFNLSYRQWKLFFHELILADGNKNKDATRSYQYGSKHEQEIDILQGLCAFNGWRTSKLKRTRLGCIYYIITINTRGVSSIERGGKLVNYNGKVWCVSVDNQTLVIRRNGKSIVAGNSHRTGKHNRTTLDGNKGAWESGCLCDLNPEYIKGRANWQLGFSIVEYYKDKIFYVNNVDIVKYSFIHGNKYYTL